MQIGDIARFRSTACTGRVAMSAGCVQYGFVHHRFQATRFIAAQVEVRETRNGYDAATSSASATKSHSDLPTTEEVLQLVGQRAASCGQVFGV
jgi:hypothetical protein